jgi:hypothetical protein
MDVVELEAPVKNPRLRPIGPKEREETSLGIREVEVTVGRLKAPIQYDEHPF